MMYIYGYYSPFSFLKTYKNVSIVKTRTNFATYVKMETDKPQVFLETTEASLTVIAHKRNNLNACTKSLKWPSCVYWTNCVFYCYNNFSTTSNTVGGGGFIADNTFQLSCKKAVTASNSLKQNLYFIAFYVMDLRSTVKIMNLSDLALLHLPC